MKKKLIALLTIFTALFALGACGTSQGGSGTQNPSHSSSNKTPETFTEFDEEDREMLEELIGFELPFIENEDYDLEDYQEYNPETGKTESIINFCMEGLDEETCEEYVSLFDEDSGYEFVDEGEDDGEFWSTYTKDGYDVKVVYSQNKKGLYTIDVYVVYDEVDGDVTSSDSDDESSALSSDTATESDTGSDEDTGSDTNSDTTSSDTGSDTDTDSDTSNTGDYEYNDFTKEEKALFNEYFGFVIPFLPSDSGYTVQDVSDETGPCLYFMGSAETKDELDAYLALYSKANGYQSQGKYIYGGNLYYTFVKEDCQIVIQIIETYTHYSVMAILTEATGVDSTIPDKGEGPYYDFMDHEKAWYEEYCGFVIPFIYNEDYTVVVMLDYENQIRFQTTVYDDNAVEDYLDLYYDNYEFISLEEDEYDSKTWYYFAKDDVTMSVCLSDYNGGTLIDVFTSKAISFAYTDFTDEEKALYEDYCGFVIPFVANNNYSVADNTADGEGLTFNVYVQPQAALQEYAYLYMYSDDYSMGFGHEESDSYVQYFYRDNFIIEMRWVSFTNGAEVSVKVKEKEEPTVYTDFTDEEKALYEDYCGFVIPFYTNKGYTVTDNTEDGEGILFTITGNLSEKAIEEYLTKFIDPSQSFESKGSQSYGGRMLIFKYLKNDCTVFFIVEEEYYNSYYVSIQVLQGDVALPEYVPADFTDEEKAIYEDNFGFVIPHIENEGYTVEETHEDGMVTVTFSAQKVNGNDFDAYHKLFNTTYKFIKQETGYGALLYYYTYNDCTICVRFWADAYVNYYVDVAVTKYVGENGGGAGGGGNGAPEEGYFYTDFTAEEKALYEKYFGFVIPFAPNNNYQLTDYSEAGEGNYLYLTIILESEEELSAYVALFSEENGYVLDEEFENGESGSYTYYYFNKNGCLVTISFTSYEGMYPVFVHTQEYENSDVGETGFTAVDLYVFKECLGFTLPYAENDGNHYVGEYYQEDEQGYITERGVEYLVYEYTAQEAEVYASLFTQEDGYTLVEEIKTDDEVFFQFQKDGFYIDILCYLDETFTMFVRAYTTDTPAEDYFYTDFTEDEAQMFNEYFGFVIPFIECYEYYVDDSWADEEYVNYYTYGNTEEEFNGYLKVFESLYELCEAGVDEYGEPYYYFKHNGYDIALLYWFSSNGQYVVDVFVGIKPEGDNPEGGENGELNV